MSKKTFDPIHPLAMATALEEINNRCGAVIMAASTARDLSAGANEAQLRTLISTVCDAADHLRDGLWSEAS